MLPRSQLRCSSIILSAVAEPARMSMDKTQQAFERIWKDDLTFPSDAAALLFGLLVFSVVIFALDKQLLSDPDTYWHIATGNWILVERGWPRHDIFSYSVFGKTWVDSEWLAQIVFSVIHHVAGWRGLVLLCGTVISLTFVILYRLLIAELRPTVALGVSAISLMFASNHFLARPHVLTLPIIVIWAAFLARASEENRRPSFWLLPLMVLWANLHGGFTLGLLLTAGFGLEAIVTARSAERWHVAIQWLSFWIAALIAGCFTPYGYSPLSETIHLFDLGEVLGNIGEMRPMNPYTEFKQEVILLWLLAMALLFGVKIGIVRILMIVGFLHLALQHIRGLAIFALILPVIIAYPLRQQCAFLQPTTDPFPLFDMGRVRSRVTCIALVAVLVGATLLGAVYTTLRRDEAPSNDITPAAALDRSIQSHLSGPVFNDYDFGGYLIFRGIPTFIDGRTLLFGKEFALEYAQAVALGGDGKLDELADAYKISWTLLRPKSAAALHFDRSPGWRRIYEDDLSVVHVRR
jgi:hypothetical protein